MAFMIYLYYCVILNLIQDPLHLLKTEGVPKQAWHDSYFFLNSTALRLPTWTIVQ